MTTKQLLALIDACRIRGVAQLKLEGVEFTLAPQMPEPWPEVAAREADATKCSKCQVAPADPRRAGLCRGCFLEQAGVAS